MRQVNANQKLVDKGKYNEIENLRDTLAIERAAWMHLTRLTFHRPQPKA